MGSQSEHAAGEAGGNVKERLRCIKAILVYLLHLRSTDSLKEILYCAQAVWEEEQGQGGEL